MRTVLREAIGEDELERLMGEGKELVTGLPGEELDPSAAQRLFAFIQRRDRDATYGIAPPSDCFIDALKVDCCCGVRMP